MDRFLKRNHWFLTLVWSFSKLDQFPESRALCMLWWRNWKVKKINLSHILSTSRHFFLEYVVQYYLYERKDDGDKIFVCNHTWFFFLSFMAKYVPCTSLFSFHFYGVRAIKPINSTTTGDLEVVIALASKESLCVYGQYEAQENINFLRISWFMNSYFSDPIFNIHKLV